MCVARVSEENPLEDDVANELYQESFEFYRSGLTDKSCSVYVATFNETIVAMGCINCFKWPPTKECLSGKAAYISGVYTQPGYRDKGIASMILSMLMKEAEQLRVEKVLLISTKIGKSIYERYGFDPWPDVMVYYV